MEPLQPASPDSEEIAENIEQQVALVGPILTEMYRKAASNEDMWLKKKSLKIVCGWTQSLQDVATLMEQQIEAMSEVIASQEAELEQLRPVKGKVWVPGLD